MSLSIGQVKKYIKQLQASRDQHVYYLGGLTLQAYREGRLSEADLKGAAETLAGVDAQIVEWEAKKSDLEAAREAARRPTCPNCGAAVAKGAGFCAGCGQQLSAPQDVACSAQAESFCPRCGCGTAPDAVFCPNCGADLRVAPPAPPAGPEPGSTTCPECGAEHPTEDIVFCPDCGSKMREG
ncbi:MAG: zinc ribbon domain-containing protein [Candidatus Geothermincolia bacterium]